MTVDAAVRVGNRLRPALSAIARHPTTLHPSPFDVPSLGDKEDAEVDANVEHAREPDVRLDLLELQLPGCPSQ